uniref:PPIase cyclophilin-type domain-containing protein n=1 Tax=Emiliania huxleyi TaxID=2903 RepID=A0A7S3WL25_EMIHU|mmetsp:Transcript_22431/g.66097  ORF Transcript_22431/g.66097 Transcript_22431/m.66097 type:complete len:191 (-) Transcript_22431:139-711(-)
MLLTPLAPLGQQRVACDTTAGPFTVLLNESLSPLGVMRVTDLVKSGFMEGQLLYRVIPGLLVQFGVAADPAVTARWQGRARRIADEPNKMPFLHGTLSFAGAGVNSRTSHLFVALSPNGMRLGRGTPHESTLGHVVEGMETFERVVANYRRSGYKDTGSLQRALRTKGNAAAADFPLLDRIRAFRLAARR